MMIRTLALVGTALSASAQNAPASMPGMVNYGMAPSGSMAAAPVRARFGGRFANTASVPGSSFSGVAPDVSYNPASVGNYINNEFTVAYNSADLASYSAPPAPDTENSASFSTGAGAASFDTRSGLFPSFGSNSQTYNRAGAASFSVSPTGCSRFMNPCDCFDSRACGWSSSRGACVQASVSQTACHECPSLWSIKADDCGSCPALAVCQNTGATTTTLPTNFVPRSYNPASVGDFNTNEFAVNYNPAAFYDGGASVQPDSPDAASFATGAGAARYDTRTGLNPSFGSNSVAYNTAGSASLTGMATAASVPAQQAASA